MFKTNSKHLQPEMFSTVNQLSQKLREKLEASWAGIFYREVFTCIDEEVFSVLYSDNPSRPNVPINLLVGLEILKAGRGWSDEEMYEHFLFDIQVRYALGYTDLGDGEFAIRSLYYFRERLSKYYLKTEINLLDSAFTDVTDAQIIKLAIRTKMQRMDSTQIASDIVNSSRLGLLVEGIQRTKRILSEEDHSRLKEIYTPYTKGSSKQYCYRVKGKDANKKHLQKVGKTMQYLLTELETNYAEEVSYQILQRLFSEHFKLVENEVKLKEKGEISSGTLQSVDDLEASYRTKAGKGYRGFVANIAETCDPENDLQLITLVQVEANNVSDDEMLAEALPKLQERMEVETMRVDGGYGGEKSDPVAEKLSVEVIQSAIRGQKVDAKKLHLADFDIELDEKGNPSKMTCPQGQKVDIQLARKSGWQARFDPEICASCPFMKEERCPVKKQKRDTRPVLSFKRKELRAAKRRKAYLVHRKDEGNLRAAAEATMRSAKHPFPAGKLPVRGNFRVTSMIIASVMHVNMKRIWRYERAVSLFNFLSRFFRYENLVFYRLARNDAFKT
jgi:hypothetical protein